MVARGEGLLLLLKRREPEREQGSFDPVAGDQHRRCQSSVEVFGRHSRLCEGGCANRSSKL